MMGYYGNFKSKKALGESEKGKAPRFIETSLHGPEYRGDGSYAVVGPCPYTARKWYATIVVRDGVIVSVK